MSQFVQATLKKNVTVKHGYSNLSFSLKQTCWNIGLRNFFWLFRNWNKMKRSALVIRRVLQLNVSLVNYKDFLLTSVLLQITTEYRPWMWAHQYMNWMWKSVMNVWETLQTTVHCSFFFSGESTQSEQWWTPVPISSDKVYNRHE